jgi:hypothetical protein
LSASSSSLALPHSAQGLDKSTGMVYIELEGTTSNGVPFHFEVKEEAKGWHPGKAVERCSG